MFRLGDDAPFLFPCAGGIAELTEQALLLPGCPPCLLRLPHQLGIERIQACILGDADDVFDVVALAQAQHAMAAEAGIAAEDDAHMRP